MSAASKAVIRDYVPYANGRGPALAPIGEYDISRSSDREICFCSCSTESRFTLSFDAVLQHCCEGRIALIGGRALPALAPSR